MKILLYFLFLCLLASCGIDNHKSTISVIGNATIKVAPDQIEVSLDVNFTKPRMADAVKETQLVMDSVLTICRKYIKNPEDIKTMSITAQKDFSYINEKEVFKGYIASQSIDVRLTDIEKFNKMSEELLTTRISTISNIRFSHSKYDSIKREINLLALEDAKRTAERMCKTMNESLGKILYMSNYRSDSRDEPVRVMNSNRLDYANYALSPSSKAFGGRGFSVTPRILEFENTVYATFEVK